MGAGNACIAQNLIDEHATADRFALRRCASAPGKQTARATFFARHATDRRSRLAFYTVRDGMRIRAAHIIVDFPAVCPGIGIDSAALGKRHEHPVTPVENGKGITICQLLTRITAVHDGIRGQ